MIEGHVIKTTVICDRCGSEGEIEDWYSDTHLRSLDGNDISDAVGVIVEGDWGWMSPDEDGRIYCANCIAGPKDE